MSMTPRATSAEHARHGAAAADGVAIDARDARAREPLAQLGLDPLGAEARLLEILAAARRRTGFGTAAA